jgi:MFS family permease
LLLPLWFLKIREATPGSTGLMLFPLGLGIFCGLPIMGRLSERFGARAISGGGALLAFAGTLPFLFATSETPYGLLAVAMFVRGFGGGSITIPSAAAAYASVPRESLGHATTSINICQRFGGPVGSAGLAIFLQFALSRAPTSGQAYHWAFGLLAGLAAAGLVTASHLPGRLAR